MKSCISPSLRWRLVVGITSAVATSLFAGCCGGPLSADGNCSCVCDDDDEADASMSDAASDGSEPDAGDAS